MPNHVPITWLVEQALRTRLQAITVANGWRTDIGLAVDLETTQEDVGDVFAAISIESCKRVERATSMRGRECVFLIEAVVPTTVANAQRRAHDAMEDVLDQFPRTEQLTLGSNVTADIAVVDSRVLNRPEGLDAICAQIDITAKIREPFS